MSREPSTDLSRPAAHALLQVIVVLWGATAILGRLISIHAIPLVWYRLIVVVLALAVIVPVRGLAVRVAPAAAARYLVVGAIIGVHWLCFYGAIKQTGVSTAVMTLSTITFFTAIIEPIVFRRRVSIGELVIGAIVVGGVALLIRLELRGDPLGLALGLGSAVFAAIFSVLNGKLTRHEPPERLMLYEMVGALLAVTACFAFAPSEYVAPSQLASADIGWLVVLAVMCTVIPQVWILHVLRVLSPFTVSVTVNLEPVYTLILAAVLFPSEEAPSARFYVGAALLIGLVIANGVRKSARAEATS